MNPALDAAQRADDESLLSFIERKMRAHFVVMKTRGMTTARTPEAFFGFRATEVIDVHFRKRGVGRGFWYRLRDGRVIDALGRSSQHGFACYLTRRPVSTAGKTYAHR